VGPPLDAEPGATVLVCAGAGSIAVYAAAMAVALGAERVDLAGGRPEERERAEKLGATLVDEAFPDRLGPYPVTVDASADQAGLACALRSTAPDGECTSIGIYFEPHTAVPLFQMYSKGITFRTGRVHARPAMDSVLELVRGGKFKPELVTGETADWADAPEAIAGHRSKLVITRAA
jgi:alcohol dehydrogenase